MGKTSAQSVNRYKRKTYYTVSATFKRSERETIQAAAAAAGLSVAGFVVQCVRRSVPGLEVSDARAGSDTDAE